MLFRLLLALNQVRDLSWAFGLEIGSASPRAALADLREVTELQAEILLIYGYTKCYLPH